MKAVLILLAMLTCLSFIFMNGQEDVNAYSGQKSKNAYSTDGL